VNDPSEPEMLAVVAAAAALLLAPRAAPTGVPGDDRSAWRFSGRWWNGPVAARRERPWAGGS